MPRGYYKISATITHPAFNITHHEEFSSLDSPTELGFFMTS
jgi:hypothetical protein